MDSENKDRIEENIEELEQIVPGDAPSENYLVVEHLQRMPSVVSRGLVYIVLLFLVTAFLYAILSKVDIVVEPKALARPASHMINVLCDRDGFVEKLFVAEGQPVEAGAPLFLIRSKEALSFGAKAEDLRKEIPLKEQYYLTKISAETDRLEQLREDHLKELNLKNLVMEQNELSLKSIELEIGYAEKEVAIYTDMLERISKLYEKGFVSMRERTSYQVSLEKARTEIEKLIKKKEIALKENYKITEELEQDNSRYVTQKSVLEKEIDNLRLEHRTTLAALRSELSLNEKMLALQDQSTTPGHEESGKMIRAQAKGTVAEVRFRSRGDYVRQSDLLCTILPAGQPLYMDITVANKDAGFIQPGQEIKYKFEAFPYIDHGVLKGRVVSVSQSAVEDGALGMVYHVKGDLDPAFFYIDGQTYPIKAGMTAIAEIVVKRKSLLAILFKGNHT